MKILVWRLSLFPFWTGRFSLFPLPSKVLSSFSWLYQYLLTNVRTSAAVCKSILANVHELVRKLTFLLTNVRTSAAVCKLILANVQKLVRKLTYLLTNVS